MLHVVNQFAYKYSKFTNFPRSRVNLFTPSKHVLKHSNWSQNKDELKRKENVDFLKLPPWLSSSFPKGESFHKLESNLRGLNLLSVCEVSRCPNIGECWRGTKDNVSTVTFMLMGDTCTRGCRFCSSKTAYNPPPLNPREPSNIAKAIAESGFHYVVFMSVSRDDVPDGGSFHFSQTVKELKARKPNIMVECISPDFSGRTDCVQRLANSGLDVFAHNVETVESLTSRVRDKRYTYRQSLSVLETAKKCQGNFLIKSSIMLGFGETDDQVLQTLKDLRSAGVDCATLGQYIPPSKSHIDVVEYVTPDKFKYWEEVGEELGFLFTSSAPLVRTSYRAGELFLKYRNKKPVAKE